jgi:hypothetical protein
MITTTNLSGEPGQAPVDLWAESAHLEPISKMEKWPQIARRVARGVPPCCR